VQGPTTLRVFKYSLWLFACAGFALVVCCLWKRRGSDNATRTWWYLAAVSLAFQLPPAIPLWRYLPELGAAEFPFRFLPLMGIALPLALLARETSRSLRRPVYVAVGLMTLLPLYQHVRLQMTPSTRSPQFSAQAAAWQSVGYRGLQEYWPVGVSAAASAIPNAVATDCNGACLATMGVYGYPYWHASDQSGHPLATANDNNGILQVTVPPDMQPVRLKFSTRSKVRWTGAAISLAGVLLVAFAIARSRNVETAR